MNTIEQNIRNLREGMDMSQERLGQIIGVSRACVSQWESGVNSPTMGNVEKMAGVFGVSVGTLIDGNISKTLTTNEKQLVSMFRSLDKSTQKIALATISAMARK